MTHPEVIEKALSSPTPLDELRSFALELSAQGISRSSIYRIFLESYKIYQSSGRLRDEDILGDVMDMISDTYAGHYLNLPD